MSYVRRTSRDTYNHVMASGIVGKRRKEAYALLYEHGPMTAQELQLIATTPGLCKRLSELRDMGLVLEQGERPCAVTTRNAIVWDVTNALPTGPYVRPAKPNSIEALLTRIEELEAENAELRSRLRTRQGDLFSH